LQGTGITGKRAPGRALNGRARPKPREDRRENARIYPERGKGTFAPFRQQKKEAKQKGVQKTRPPHETQRQRFVWGRGGAA